MNALVLADDLRYVTNYPRPEPGPDEALVRVSLAAICGTDLELLEGYGGFRGVPGHEFVGVVEEAPGSEWVGRRVVAEISVAAGPGDPRHAKARQVVGIRQRDGAFAQWVAVPLRNLHAVPDRVPDDQAVFTESLAAALRVREQGLARVGQRVAVLGPGRLGLLVGQVLALDGTHLTMLGRTGESLKRAARLGLATALVDEAPASGFDVVVEATGNADGVTRAIGLARPLGTVVLKSTVAGLSPVDVSAAVVKELSLIGSRCGPFAPALKLLARGGVAVEPLIEAVYPLADGLAAFEHAARPGALKVLLEP